MSHGVRGFIAAQCAGQIVLDLLLRVAAVLIAELYADARGTLALRAFRRHPDDAAGDGQLFFLAHEIEQHENFIAQAIIAVGRDEQAAVFDERHVGKIERALILDGERQQAWFVTLTSQFLPFHSNELVFERRSTIEQHGLERQLVIHAGRREKP